MRAGVAVALALVLVVAGCSAPGTPDAGSPGADGTTTAPPADAGTGTPTPSSTDAGEEPATTSEGTDAAAGARPDPAQDVEGWEDGYWYDDPLAVTRADGLNDSELDAVVARAMARVEQVRGVEFDRDVPVEVVPRSALDGSGGSGEGGGGDGSPSAARVVTDVKYRALFLVGDATGDGDGNASERESATRQASLRGYYSIARDSIVLVTDRSDPVPDEVVLAQELYHAHQFRHRTLRLPEGYTDDHVLAMRALVEGDANLVDRLYERRCDADWDCVRPGSPGGDGGDAGDGEDGAGDGGADGDGNASVAGGGFHVGLYLLSYVPYAEGEPWVASVYRRGGWAAVDALYDDPPRSSEQVIHPATKGDDPPEHVAVPDRSGDAWTRVVREGRPSTVTVGEAGLATMFAYTAYDDRPGELVAREDFLNVDRDGRVNATDPLDYDVNYSAGWAGDAMAVYERDDGARGYVWRLRFDDAGEAREFARGYRRLLDYRGGERVADADREVWRLDGAFGGAYALEVDGRTATVASAPSRPALRALWPDRDVGSG